MATAPPRILYVDDDAGLRRVVQRALGRRGFAVELAAGADEGLARLRGERFDLVAIDYYMPGKDGLAMLHEVLAQPDAPPVVFVTGTEETHVAVTALKSGAVDFVVKAVGDHFFDLLANSLGAALDKVALSRAKAAAEEELRQANARLEVLLGEVHHRVANSLQLVSAFVSMQAAHVEAEEAKVALAETQKRIQAVVQIHRRLYTSNRTDTIALDAYLESLIGELRHSLAIAGGAITLTLRSDPVELKPDHAISIGVIVTELVGNAAKYAFDGNGPGSIEVTLERDQRGGFVVTVCDDGRGFDPARPPQGSGLGMRIVEAMAKSLDSRMELKPRERGACLEVRVPG